MFFNELKIYFLIRQIIIIDKMTVKNLYRRNINMINGKYIS